MLQPECPSRAQWMRTNGKDIYQEWATELLAVREIPRYWQTFLDILSASSYHMVGRYPIQAMGVALAARESDMTTADTSQGTSKNHLYPHIDEIMTYTSAANFSERETFFGTKRVAPEAAVESHAYDSLRFAFEFTVGAANDIYLARSGDTPKQTGLDYFTSSGGREHFSQLRGILQDQAFIEGMYAAAGTGFDVLGVDAALIEHAREDLADRGFPSEGWKMRALQCGIFDDASQAFAETKVQPIFELNATGTILGLRPKVLQHLRNKLQEQNTDGLDVSARIKAGNIATLEGALSSGCPLRNTPVIAQVASFAARACDVVVNNSNDIRV